MSTIGERLKKFREINDITQTEMAEAMSVSDRQYSRYEKNEAKIPSNKLSDLCDTTNLNMTWLLTGRGEMYNATSEMGNRFVEIFLDLDMEFHEKLNLLNISEKEYWHYKKGFWELPYEILNKLYELGYNISWYFTGRGEMKNTQEESAELAQLRKEIANLEEEDAVLEMAVRELRTEYNRDADRVLSALVRLLRILVKYP